MAAAAVWILFISCLSMQFLDTFSLNATSTGLNIAKKKTSEQILIILDHYKQEDPLGIPGAPVPDPLEVPPFSQKFSVGTMHFKNAKVYGLKKFRIEHIKVDIAAMQLELVLTIDELQVRGDYTLSSFFSSAKGPFAVNMSDVYVEALASLEIERTGKLEAQEINMDIKFKRIKMDFQNLGFFASMFQGVINSVGDSLFNSIKPFILSEVNNNIRADVNKELRKLPQKFPNSISPFDQMIILVRKEIRNKGMDPFKINDYNNTVGIFEVFMRRTWLYGLSSIHRDGQIEVQYINKTIYASFYVGTQNLQCTTDWEIALVAGIISKTGKVDFTIEYFRVQVNVSQSMDTDTPPKLEDIQLELGNIQIRFDGAGSLDYLLESGVNILPNLLRYQVMDALENPIKLRIQEALNTVNIKSLIVENADKIDNPSILHL